MKKLYLFFATIVLVSGVKAQQQALFSQYMLNGYIYNPALAGMEDYTDVKSSYRKQWLGMPNSPSTMYVSVSAALNQKDLNKEELGSLPMRGASSIRFKTDQPKKIRHGVGGFIMNDNAALVNKTSAYVGYAIHIPLSQVWYLSAGANAGFAAYTLNKSRLELRQQDDPAFANRNLTAIPDLNLGLWLYSEKAHFGISSNQLLNNKYSFNRDNSVSVNNQLTNHLYAIGAYKFNISTEFELQPTGMVRFTPGAPISIDLGGKLRYQNGFWVGASYRVDREILGNAFVGLVGFNIYKFIDLSYSFDFATSRIAQGNSASHEIVLGLRLNNKSGRNIAKLW